MRNPIKAFTDTSYMPSAKQWIDGLACMVSIFVVMMCMLLWGSRYDLEQRHAHHVAREVANAE